MFFQYLVASLLPLAAIASPAPIPDAAVAEVLEARAVNGHCSGTATGVYLDDGICVTTTTCNAYSGSYITGGCPNDVANVKCCVVGLDPVTVNPCGGTSYCDWTANGCAGSWISGHCPGGSNFKCCLRS